MNQLFIKGYSMYYLPALCIVGLLMIIRRYLNIKLIDGLKHFQ